MLNVQSRPWPGQPWRVPALARRFSKFSLIGASGVVVNLSVFWLLTSALGFHYLVAGALAIEVALCSNYVLNNSWTFADRRTRWLALAGPARYHAVSLGGIFINLTTLHILVGYLDVHAMLANLTGIALGTGWNFALNLCWTWRAPAAAG